MQLKEYQNNGQNKAIYDSALVFLWCFFIQLFNFPNKLAVLLGILFCAVIVWKKQNICRVREEAFADNGIFKL